MIVMVVHRAGSAVGRCREKRKSGGGLSGNS